VNHTAMLVAASSGPPPIVTSSAQALIPAMVGALAFIVAAAVTILAVFMQSEKSNRYARALCALGIVYLLVASFCSLRDAIFALTTRPPGTLPALRGVAWTILFPALCGLVVIGVVACIMMAQFVCDWTPKRADPFYKIGYRTFPIFTIALAPVIAIGLILSPYRIILLPGWLVKGVVVVAIILMTGFVVLIKTHEPSGVQPVAARATGVGKQSPRR
jgi:hypothetical protein